MIFFTTFLLFGVVAHAGKPVVEVSLASGPAIGSVSSAIANADAVADVATANAVGALENTYKGVLAEATAALGATISRALAGRASFANIEDPVLAVQMAPGSNDQTAGVSAERILAAKRDASLGALVQTGSAELRELAKVVISAYDREIRSHRGSFLKARYSRELNVRVQADPNYTSVASLLDDGQIREDNREFRIRNKVLALQLRLCQALNGIAKAALAGR